MCTCWDTVLDLKVLLQIIDFNFFWELALFNSFCKSNKAQFSMVILINFSNMQLGRADIW